LLPNPRAREADERFPRPAPDGVGCLRFARRAICRRKKRPSPNYDTAEHQHVPQANQIARFLLRLGPGSRYHGPKLLQMDAMDLSGNPRYVVRLNPKER